MKTIQVSDEDYEFLKDLQYELSTQTNDGNADPVFWGIMEDEEVAVPEGFGESKIVYDDGSWTVEEAINQVNEVIHEYGNDAISEWNDVWKENASDIAEFMNNTLKWDVGVLDFVTEERICRFTGAFLTKREAKRYVDTYGYNHNNPRTYAMTAFRNFELERLLKILKSFE